MINIYYNNYMTDLIHQIIEMAKNIAHMFDTTLLAPLTVMAKSIGVLLGKILELIIMAIEWIIAKI
jgi:hypothetical protein